MSIEIETFSNFKGGNSFYKAISHPLAASKIQKLIENVSSNRKIALYDPLGFFSEFSKLYDTSSFKITSAFVSDIERVGSSIAGCLARPISEIIGIEEDFLFVATYDLAEQIGAFRHLIPHKIKILSFDEIRLDNRFLTNKDVYLESINFATNFAFFRDQNGMRTQIVTANYWFAYGAKDVFLHLILFGEDGKILLEWDECLDNKPIGVIIDSKTIRQKFGLKQFTGQLFIHAIGIRGHDVVKYCLDTWHQNGKEISCTHDANSWPAELYAGLPAPNKGEKVVLWVQNSHAESISANAIGFNIMGKPNITKLKKEIPGYATLQVSLSEILPDAKWPEQIEIKAGKHFVRPRYEITNAQKNRRIAHVNVERNDLISDPSIPQLTQHLNKGFILPAPVFPIEKWRSTILPTPMATCQQDLPIAVLLVNEKGEEIAHQKFGSLSRDHKTAIDTKDLLEGNSALNSSFGHLELIYDFSNGGNADGWLHAIFRYENRKTGHTAETSFGAHMFNTVLTYKGEPQSYSGPPPGLSTRLFLRLGRHPLDTICHLIYPASAQWHDTSTTLFTLYNCAGKKIAEETIKIPCGGSHLWRFSTAFDPKKRYLTDGGSYVVIRDKTCRLFGYHGLFSNNGAFSFDHLFGF